jgi:hypothetical protein
VTITKSARQILRYGEAQIPYSIVVNPKRKQRVKINVHSDGMVEVETPERTPKEDIAKAVQKRARWIVTHVAGARKRFEQVLPREYVSGEQIFYLGRRYSLKVRQGPKRDRSVRLKGALLEVTTDDRSREAVRTLVKAWYREKAHDYFVDRMKAVASGMPWKVEVPPIRLRDMKKRWGSCAVNGAITLNPALVRAPRECIDYVITHELCHLREHNHSRGFFRLMNRAVSDWEHTKARLDGMAELLMNV